MVSRFNILRCSLRWYDPDDARWIVLAICCLHTVYKVSNGFFEMNCISPSSWFCEMLVIKQIRQWAIWSLIFFLIRIGFLDGNQYVVFIPWNVFSASQYAISLWYVLIILTIDSGITKRGRSGALRYSPSNNSNFSLPANFNSFAMAFITGSCNCLYSNFSSSIAFTYAIARLRASTCSISVPFLSVNLKTVLQIECPSRDSEIKVSYIHCTDQIAICH